METNERDRALVEIILAHLKVTERILDIQVKTLDALHAELAYRQVDFQQHPTLQELLLTTHELAERVQSILGPK